MKRKDALPAIVKSHQIGQYLDLVKSLDVSPLEQLQRIRLGKINCTFPQ